MKVKEDFKERLRRFKRNKPVLCIHIAITIALAILIYLLGSFITLSWSGVQDYVIESMSSRGLTVFFVIVQQFMTYGIIRDFKK